MTPISELGQIADASVRSLPAAGIVVVFAALVGGLLMWAFGGRLVKPMYGFLFGVVGSVCGLFLPAGIGIAINPYLGAGVGAVAGALIGVLLFRVSMATSLGIAGGVLAPTIAAAIMWLNPAATGASTGRPLSGAEMLLPGVPLENTAADPGAGARSSDPAKIDPTIGAALDTASGLARSATHRLRSFAGELAHEAAAEWSDLPGDQRLVLGISGVLGALAGFLLGLSFPKKVAAIGSAFLGAGVWAPTSAKLITDFSLPGANALPETARGWLALWLILSATGLVLQWTVFKRRADKPARAE